MNFKTSKNLELKLEMVSQEREMNNMIATHIIDVAKSALYSVQRGN